MMSGRDVGGDVPSEMTAILREAAGRCRREADIPNQTDQIAVIVSCRSRQRYRHGCASRPPHPHHEPRVVSQHVEGFRSPFASVQKRARTRRNFAPFGA